MTDLNLSDIAAVTGGSGLGGNNGGIILLIILFFIFGMGGNNKNNAATTEDLASGFNFNSLQNKTNETLAAINNVNQNLGNAICQTGYQNAKDFANISQQISNCCCETQRSIDSVKFDMANYASSINANTTANIQKVLDKMAADKEAALQARISQLELDRAMCGVVRWPMQTTFSSNCNPFNSICS